MEPAQINRLMTVVVQIQDVNVATNALNEIGLSVTDLSSSGGFLGGRNVTLLIGLTNGEEEKVVQILRKTCRRRVEYVTTSLEGAPFHLPISTPVPVGGATVFTLAVERYEVF
jgi:uncharacterized protein YaaQ